MKIDSESKVGLKNAQNNWKKLRNAVLVRGVYGEITRRNRYINLKKNLFAARKRPPKNPKSKQENIIRPIKVVSVDFQMDPSLGPFYEQISIEKSKFTMVQDVKFDEKPRENSIKITKPELSITVSETKVTYADKEIEIQSFFILSERYTVHQTLPIEEETVSIVDLEVPLVDNNSAVQISDRSTMKKMVSEIVKDTNTNEIVFNLVLLSKSLDSDVIVQIINLSEKQLIGQFFCPQNKREILDDIIKASNFNVISTSKPVTKNENIISTIANINSLLNSNLQDISSVCSSKESKSFVPLPELLERISVCNMGTEDDLESLFEIAANINFIIYAYPNYEVNESIYILKIFNQNGGLVTSTKISEDLLLRLLREYPSIIANFHVILHPVEMYLHEKVINILNFIVEKFRLSYFYDKWMKER